MSRETGSRQDAFPRWSSDAADSINPPHRLSLDAARAKGRTFDRGGLGKETSSSGRYKCYHMFCIYPVIVYLIYLLFTLNEDSLGAVGADSEAETSNWGYRSGFTFDFPSALRSLLAHLTSDFAKLVL